MVGLGVIEVEDEGGGGDGTRDAEGKLPENVPLRWRPMHLNSQVLEHRTLVGTIAEAPAREGEAPDAGSLVSIYHPLLQRVHVNVILDILVEETRVCLQELLNLN